MSAASWGHPALLQQQPWGAGCAPGPRPHGQQQAGAATSFHTPKSPIKAITRGASPPPVTKQSGRQHGLSQWGFLLPQAGKPRPLWPL